jgi:hypothetical protein
MLQHSAIVDRNRSRFLLLIIPASTDICDECGAGSIDPKTYPAYRRSALTDALEEIARQQQVQHLNLFDTPWAREDALNYFRRGGTSIGTIGAKRLPPC